MSFLSGLKTVWHAVTVGANDIQPFAGFLGAIPGVGPIIETALQSIVAVEQIVTVSNSGAAKKAAAMQLINAVHPGLDQASLGTAIDGIVTALNLIEQALSKLPTAAKPA